MYFVAQRLFDFWNGLCVFRSYIILSIIDKGTSVHIIYVLSEKWASFRNLDWLYFRWSVYDWWCELLITDLKKQTQKINHMTFNCFLLLVDDINPECASQIQFDREANVRLGGVRVEMIGLSDHKQGSHIVWNRASVNRLDILGCCVER